MDTLNIDGSSRKNELWNYLSTWGEDVKQHQAASVKTLAVKFLAVLLITINISSLAQSQRRSSKSADTTLSRTGDSKGTREKDKRSFRTRLPLLKGYPVLIELELVRA